MGKVLQNFLSNKAFRVELDDMHAFPGTKGFLFPTDDVIVGAIVMHAEKEHEKVEFINYTKPITFWITETKKRKNEIETKREKYEAELVRGSTPRNLGYYIMCHKVSE